MNSSLRWIFSGRCAAKKMLSSMKTGAEVERFRSNVKIVHRKSYMKKSMPWYAKDFENLCNKRIKELNNDQQN